MSAGIVSGDMRSGPRSSRVFQDSPEVVIPPIPFPTSVPTRRMSGRCASSKPASFHASTAATTAYCEKRSRWRISLRSSAPVEATYPAKSFTSPATWHVQRDGSNFVILPIPLTPALMLAQAAAVPFPTGVTIPMPVITTFFIFSASPSQCLFAFRGTRQSAPRAVRKTCDILRDFVSIVKPHFYPACEFSRRDKKREGA